MVTDLSAILSASSPTVTESTETPFELQSLFDLAFRASQLSRRHRRLRVAIPAVAVALVLGGTTTAFASPTIQNWLGINPSQIFPWTAQVNGHAKTCLLGLEVKAAADPATLVAARNYVSSLDFTAIQQGTAYRAAYASVQSMTGTTTRGKQFIALTRVVSQMVVEKLGSEDLNTAGIILVEATNCSDPNH